MVYQDAKENQLPSQSLKSALVLSEAFQANVGLRQDATHNLDVKFIALLRLVLPGRLAALHPQAFDDVLSAAHASHLPH